MRSCPTAGILSSSTLAHLPALSSAIHSQTAYRAATMRSKAAFFALALLVCGAAAQAPAAEQGAAAAGPFSITAIPPGEFANVCGAGAAGLRARWLRQQRPPPWTAAAAHEHPVPAIWMHLPTAFQPPSWHRRAARPLGKASIG